MSGRIGLCGSVSDYDGVAAGPANILHATAKPLTLTGFRGILQMDLVEEMQQRIGGWRRGRHRAPAIDLRPARPGADRDGTHARRAHRREDACPHLT